MEIQKIEKNIRGVSPQADALFDLMGKEVGSFHFSPGFAVLFGSDVLCFSAGEDEAFGTLRAG